MANQNVTLIVYTNRQLQQQMRGRKLIMNSRDEVSQTDGFACDVRLYENSPLPLITRDTNFCLNDAVVRYASKLDDGGTYFCTEHDPEGLK